MMARSASNARALERPTEALRASPMGAMSGIVSACAALAADFTPISDMRASADIRLCVAQNLLRRFFRETVGEVGATVYTYGR